MRAVFIAFAVTNSLLIAATAIVGAMVDGERFFALHFALGLVTTLVVCLAHCVVLTYFMATSKMIALAVADARLDPALARAAADNKLRAIRVLMPAVLLVLAAAITGGYVTRNESRSNIHLLIVLAASGFQWWAWRVEYHLILCNGRSMDETFEAHRKCSRPSPDSPAASTPLRTDHRQPGSLT